MQHNKFETKTCEDSAKLTKCKQTINMASLFLVGFWTLASFCILLSSVILTISATVSQAFEDLLLYGKIRTEHRKWSVVQLIEVPKR